MWKWGLIAAAVCIGLTSVAPAWAAPSFDCTKAVTVPEKAICADDRLAQLDVELAALYKTALARGVVTQDAQREWLKKRSAECKAKGDYTVTCVGGLMRERLEDLRQRNLTGLIATTTSPQFQVINVPPAWWGFTPVYPEGVKNPEFDDVFLRDGRIIARLYWDEPGPERFHFRWVDVVTGEIVADSANTPELAKQMQSPINVVRLEEPKNWTLPGRLRFEDGRRIEFEHMDLCDWPLTAGAALVDTSGDVQKFGVLRKLDNEHAFHLVNTSLCPRFEHGPKSVTSHFETMSFDILFGAPDGTLVALLLDADRAGNGHHLVRFREDLSSPYYQATSDLAVVRTSDVRAVEQAGTDAPPESRFVGLDALFAKARAEAGKR